jgi:hypothetical protein
VPRLPFAATLPGSASHRPRLKCLATRFAMPDRPSIVGLDPRIVMFKVLLLRPTDRRGSRGRRHRRPGLVGRRDRTHLDRQHALRRGNHPDWVSESLGDRMTRRLVAPSRPSRAERRSRTHQSSSKPFSLFSTELICTAASSRGVGREDLSRFTPAAALSHRRMRLRREMQRPQRRETR